MSPEESVIREFIAQLAAVPAGALRSDQRLVADLKIDGDDYGMWLVPELQKRFSIRPSIAEWESAPTVGELIALVERHLSKRQPTR